MVSPRISLSRLRVTPVSDPYNSPPAYLTRRVLVTRGPKRRNHYRLVSGHHCVSQCILKIIVMLVLVSSTRVSLIPCTKSEAHNSYGASCELLHLEMSRCRRVFCIMITVLLDNHLVLNLPLGSCSGQPSCLSRVLAFR